jgi:methyl-accepting chemotaxis protein
MGFLHSLRAKLLASFLVLIVLTACLGVVGLTQLASLRDNSHKSYQQSTVPLVHVQAVATEYAGYLATATSAPSQADPAIKAQTLQLGQASLDRLYTALDVLNKDALATKTEQDARTSMNQNWNDYAKLAGLSKGAATLPSLSVNADFQKVVALLTAYQKASADLQGELTKDALASDTKAADAYTDARNLLIGGLIVAALIGVAFAFAIASWFVRPIRKTVSVLDDVANGDLTQRLDVDRKDELGQMATALNGTLATVDSVIAQIQGDATLLADQATKGSNPELASMAENLNAMTSIFQVSTN